MLQPQKKASGSAAAARRFLVLYCGAAKLCEWGCHCHRLLSDALFHTTLLLLLPARSHACWHGFPSTSACFTATHHLAAALADERTYLARLAAARKAAAAAQQLEEEALAATITGDGECRPGGGEHPCDVTKQASAAAVDKQHNNHNNN